jgi:hypothetical protein
MYGPITGTFPTNPAIVPKKSPKSTKMPYSSTKKPMRGQRRRISRMPATKAAVPFSFCRRAKKRAVFWRPMIRVRPAKKRICGIERVREARPKERKGDGEDARCPLLA